ncbi:MAG: CDP-alcohol phosphatidyltransferase family protein [Candidatus Acetothermia bacterium]|jgi:phosphatidylglycerophosphate synthase|nr:CDP-alcohol phosphatidyltransferase family protein [Candidatus Acetothermia bacterium]MDH7505771.1 CDP-alcohol phosphatidyltransferase family protein [Candidatus Acetothermia bacterium]
MARARIPDLLTFARLPLGVVIALHGLAGRRAAGTVMLLLLLGWSLDFLDGRLARRLKEEPGWIGEYEILFDLVLCLGSLAYLGLAGFIPWPAALGYITLAGTVAGLATAITTAERTYSITQVVEVPLIFIPPIFLLLASPWWIILVTIIWALLSLALEWDRAMELKGKVVESHHLTLAAIWRLIRRG